MSKNELKKSALIVLSIHIAFMLYAFLPIFKPLKDISPLSGMKLNIVYQLVLIIAIVVTLKGYLAESWKNLLSRGLWKNIKAIILGILIIIALLYAWRFIDYFLTGFRYDINGANQDAVEGMATSFSLPFLLLSILGGPFTEECIYRGIVYHLFQKINTFMAVIMSSALFAGIHIISTIGTPDFKPLPMLLLFMNYFMGGLGFSLIYCKYKNIWLNIIIHALWNGVMAGLMIIFG